MHSSEEDDLTCNKSQFKQGAAGDQYDPQFDAREQLGVSPNYMERRRGSMVEARTDANKELIVYSQKEVKVRTPRRGRSKSIVVPGTSGIPRNFPIGRLNNYNKNMKRHKGPLSLASELESIEEGDSSDREGSSGVGENFEGGILFDCDMLQNNMTPQEKQDSRERYEEEIKERLSGLN